MVEGIELVVFDVVTVVEVFQVAVSVVGDGKVCLGRVGRCCRCWGSHLRRERGSKNKRFLGL